MLTEKQQRIIKLLDDAVKEAKYGNISVNVLVKDGEPVLESVSLTIMKRRKYKMP